MWLFSVEQTSNQCRLAIAVSVSLMNATRLRCSEGGMVFLVGNVWTRTCKTFGVETISCEIR